MTLFAVIAAVSSALVLGAAAFAGIDYLIDERWGDEGGAVIASLATEIFPKAFRRDHHMAGVATALGFLAALALIERTAGG